MRSNKPTKQTHQRRVAICTAFSEDFEAGDLTAPINASYAAKCGYTWICDKLPLSEMLSAISPRTNCTWYKVSMLLRILRSGEYDWVVWIDADAVIVQHGIKRFDELFDEFSDKDLIIGEDVTGCCSVNAGVMLVRTTPWSLACWNAVWLYERHFERRHFEQSALQRHLKKLGEGLERVAPFHSFLGGPETKLTPHCAILARPRLNSTIGTEAEFIYHATGGWKLRKLEAELGRRKQRFAAEDGASAPALHLQSTLHGHKRTVWALAALGGDVLISGSGDKTLRLWRRRSRTDRSRTEVSGATCMRVIPAGHAVRRLAVIEGGRRVVSGGFDHSLCLWDSNDWGCIAMHACWGERVLLELVALGKQDLVATGSSDGTILVCDAAQGTTTAALSGAHRGGVWSLATDVRRADRLFSGGFDGVIRVWGKGCAEDAWACVATLPGHEGTVMALEFAPSNNLLVSAARASLKLWHVASSESGEVHCEPKSSVQVAAQRLRVVECLSQLGGVAVVAAHLCGGSCVPIDLAGKCGLLARSHTRPVCSVEAAAFGVFVATGSHDHTIKLWVLRSG